MAVPSSTPGTEACPPTSTMANSVTESANENEPGLTADSCIANSEPANPAIAAEMNKDVVGFTPDGLRALTAYSFPGNVRELENVIERAVALAGSRVIGLGDLPETISGHAAAPAASLLELPADGLKLDDVLSEAERRLLVAALERSGGVRKRAAELLGITFRSLRYRLQKQGLGDGDDVDAGDV